MNYMTNKSRQRRLVVIAGIILLAAFSMSASAHSQQVTPTATTIFEVSKPNVVLKEYLPGKILFNARYLAFIEPDRKSAIGGNPIYTLDLMSHAIQRIGPDMGVGPNQWRPEWGFAKFSPDGKQILFSVAPTPLTIGLINSDGTNYRNLTDPPGFNPQWLPDGNRISFFYKEVFIANLDGEILQVISGLPENTSMELWHPTRHTLLYVTPDGVYEVTDSTNAPVRLGVELGNSIFYPAWSPDGKRVAVVMNTGDNQEIFVINEDGTGKTNLTNSPGYDVDPAWSPDSKQIIFVSNRDTLSLRDHEQRPDLFIMNADGSNVRKVVECECTSPNWSK